MKSVNFSVFFILLTILNTLDGMFSSLFPPPASRFQLPPYLLAASVSSSALFVFSVLVSSFHAPSPIAPYPRSVLPDSPFVLPSRKLSPDDEPDHACVSQRQRLTANETVLHLDIPEHPH